MDWQKLNEVDTYKQLWNIFKGLFHKRHHDDNTGPAADEGIVNEAEAEIPELQAADTNSAFKQINLLKIGKAALKHWYLYVIWCIIMFAVACIIILPVPRTYDSTVKLAPELSNMMGSGSLSSIAEQFGVDLGGAKLDGGDAILPELYPDLMESVDFQTGLFNIPVKTINGDVSTTYYDYLAHRQKSSWLDDLIGGWTKSIKDKLDHDTDDAGGDNGKVNPFRLTKEQTEVCRAIAGNIKCAVDKKNYVISIMVRDQDPLICATIADSVKLHLQKFITRYRTQKAQNDLDYTLKLQDDAKKRYEQARREYAAYSDAHQDLILQEYQSKAEDLENEMQLRYNAYSALATQVQAARAKLREKTPAFTTLQSATVPIKPSGPKRMIFCGVVLIITIVVVTIYAAVKEDRKERKAKRARIRKPESAAKAEDSQG